MSQVLDSLRASWGAETARLRGEIMYSAVSAALLEMGTRMLQALGTEIERLEHELDAYGDCQVFRCMDRDIPAAMVALYAEHAPDGTRIRTTDTGRELVLTGGAWLPP